MPLDKYAAVQEMCLARNKYTNHCAKFRAGKPPNIPDAELFRDNAEVFTSLKSTIYRHSPAGSVYRMPIGGKEETIHTLAGALLTLIDDWNAGRLQSFEERIHGQTFSDFLATAEHFLSDAYNDPAAVVAAATIAGGVLEQHLRSLCVKHVVDPNFINKKGEPEPKTINALNADLYRTPPGAYTQDFMEHIKGWAVIRNHAAHGESTEVHRQKVELMLQGIRLFVTSYPA